MNANEISVSVRPHLKELVELAGDYLEPNGWFTSVKLGRSVDLDGNPLPWITYPAIEMLRRIDILNGRVFEYGAGNSSLWWATRAV